jgi:aspartate racemase
MSDGHVLAKNKSATTTINSNPHFTSVQLIDATRVVLGIGGGVGPSAGVGLHQKIIDNTKSTTDQGHFSVIHICRAPHIPDRTKFLLGEIDTNPGIGMAEAVWAIASAAKTNDEVAVVAVPCNTFHAPPVWRSYVNHLRSLGADGSAVRLIHMLDECVSFIKDVAPSAKRIGLMSTTGTRESRVYRDLLEPQGYEVLEVPAVAQFDVHETIYNQEWGINSWGESVIKCMLIFI